MINKKANSNGISLISLILIILIIVIILVLVIFTVKVLFPSKNTVEEYENVDYVSKENKTSIDNNSNVNKANTNTVSGDNSGSTIKLNIGNKEKITGGELLTINDYKINIPSELVQIGYNITTEDNSLRIKSEDNSYECVLVQLSDNYIMPTEEEIDALYETPEYKQLEDEDYNLDDESFDLHLEKEEQISTNYYKSLGYTAQNSPNYVLTSKELDSIIGKYYLEGESKGSGSNGLFPGYQYYNYYDWGKTTLYTIPKYYNDSTFGENTSEFSICLYLFEYYDSSNVNFNVDLWRF